MSQSTDPQTGQSEAAAPSKTEEGTKLAVRGSDGDPDEDIPHPYLELYRHTLLRGANMGSVLALLLGPPVLLYRGVRQPAEFLRRLGSICTKGVVSSYSTCLQFSDSVFLLLQGLGMGVAALMTVAMTWGNQEEQISDRCYRLRYSKGQVRTDNFTYGGAVAGGLAGMALASNTARVAGGLNGASMAVGLAVFAHVASKPKDKKSD